MQIQSRVKLALRSLIKLLFSYVITMEEPTYCGSSVKAIDNIFCEPKRVVPAFLELLLRFIISPGKIWRCCQT